MFGFMFGFMFGGLVLCLVLCMFGQSSLFQICQKVSCRPIGLNWINYICHLRLTNGAIALGCCFPLFFCLRVITFSVVYRRKWVYPLQENCAPFGFPSSGRLVIPVRRPAHCRCVCLASLATNQSARLLGSRCFLCHFSHSLFVNRRC